MSIAIPSSLRPEVCYQSEVAPKTSTVSSPFFTMLSGGVLALGINNIFEEIELQKKAVYWGHEELFRSHVRLSAEAFGVMGSGAELLGEAARHGYLPYYLSLVPLSFIGDVTTFIYSMLKSLASMAEFNLNFNTWSSTDCPEIKKVASYKAFSKMLQVACYVSLISLTILHLVVINIAPSLLVSLVVPLSSALALFALSSLVTGIILDYHVKIRYPENPKEVM